MTRQIGIILCLLPVYLRWLLPASAELRLVIDIAGFPLFFPDLLFFVGIGLLKTRINFSAPVMTVLLSQFILSLVGMFSNEYDDFLYYILGAQWCFLFLGMVLVKEVQDGDLRGVKAISMLVFAALGMQVVLFSLGVLHYEGISGQEEYLGLQRVSTTVGAATGTACVLYMLGGLIFTRFMRAGWEKYLFLVIWVFVMLLTNSRGGIFALAMFCVAYFLLLFLKGSYVKKVSLLILCGAGVYQFQNANAYKAVEERTAYKLTSGAFDSGRLDRIRYTLSTVEGHELFGLGNGNVFPPKELFEIYPPRYGSAPHNYYVLIFAEQGWIGITLHLLFIVILLHKIFSKGVNDLSLVALFAFLVLMNTESVFVFNEYYAFLMCLVLIRISEINSLAKPQRVGL